MRSRAALAARLSRAQAARAGAVATLAALAERAQLTLTGVSVAVVAAASWFVARALSSRTLFLIVYAAVFAVGMAWVVSRRRLALSVVRSSLPARTRVGQTLEVDLRVTTSRRVSTILVHETVHDGLGSPVQVSVPVLRPGDEIEHSYALRPTRRGVYQVGPTIATWSDPLGLTTHTQELLAPTEIIVHPSTEAVQDRVLTRMWEDPPIRPPVSKPWPSGFEFYGLRDYVPGDDLRRVVWNAVAKTGRMLVRESEQGITDRIVVCIDSGTSWHDPHDPSPTFETAVRVAASVGARHLDDGFGVTLLDNTGRLAGPLRGARARLEYLDALSRLQPSDVPFAKAGDHLLNEAKGGTHLLVVTPHLDQHMASRLRVVMDRGSSVVVAFVMWEETDFLSLHRAAALGCRVLQVPVDGALATFFSMRAGALR